MINHKKVFFEALITGLICFLTNYYLPKIINFEKDKNNKYFINAINTTLIIFISVPLKIYTTALLLN